MGVSNMHSPRAMFSDTWCSVSLMAHVADLGVGSGVGICVHGRNRRVNFLRGCRKQWIVDRTTIPIAKHPNMYVSRLSVPGK